MMEIGSSDEIKERLEEIINSRVDDLLADTAKILSFETVSGGTEEQEGKYRQQIPACFDWLATKAEEFGFRFQQWDNRVGEIEWPAQSANGKSSLKSVGIASHIDVVTPVGNWKHGPFEGKIDEGVLYGRGIQDDKGPLIQVLHGMAAVKEAGIKLPFDVRVIIGTSEETGDWTDLEYYVKKRGAPDCSFTPDAEFPVITGEKGMLNVIFRAQWPEVKADEDTGMEFVSLKGGERANIIPSLTEVLLRFPAENKDEVMKEMVRETTRFTVENRDANVTLVPNNEEESEEKGHYESLLSFIGKAAHSSKPEKGHNAIVDALRFFSDIESLPPTVRAFVQFLAIVGSESDGSTLDIQSDHEFVGATTAAMTLCQIRPDGGEATLNVRPTMGLTLKELREKCRHAAQSFQQASGLEIDVSDDGHAVEAIYLDPEQPGVGTFLASLQEAFESVTQQPGDPMSIGGTTYAKALPNCCAFGPVLTGVDESLAHQPDERMSVESIKRNALIYGTSLALMAIK